MRRRARRRRCGDLVIDTTPLRASRQFRLLMLAQLLSLVGNDFTAVAVVLQVYLLTRSSLLVGVIGLVQAVPLLAGMLAGGALADAMDRRRLLVVTRMALAVVGVALALNAGAGQRGLWLVFPLIAANAALTGLGGPARSAPIAAMVGPDLLPAASALNATMHQVGAVAGPALAGVLIARAGVAAAYWVDVASFGLQLVVLGLMRPIPPGAGGRRAGLASVLEGLRYVRGKPLLCGLLLIDLNAMVFGMPRALFPALGTGLFHGGADVVGLLYAAPGAGALLGAATSGWVSRVRRAGLAVVVAVVLWGAAITAFGLVPWLPLALGLLALAGFADVVSEVFRTTLMQLSAPDGLRGRVVALWQAQVTGAPKLGDAEAGAVAALTTPQVSVVSGGLACIAGAIVLARLIPQLRRASVAELRPPASASSTA
ncbi:MAG TPA: MFS transporter [Actinomycetes bacterium]|jgi:ENTS family enterobactin (siderophore) exporter|nr:MFS transporter [Actinomycetes bacterium]